MRLRGIGLAAAVSLWLLGGVSALASDQLDQAQPFFTGSQAFRTPMAQTFTAGGNGAIDRVSLMVSTWTGATGVTVQIQTVSAGKPSGTVLGSSTFTGAIPCCHVWHDFAFSPTVPVSGSTQYAIVVLPTGGSLTWYANFGYDGYTRGQLWLASGTDWLGGGSLGYDYCFQTYLTTGASNRPPTVGVNSAAVSAPEGSTVSNAGTFSDPDGDTVAISASQGAVTKSGTSSGTWSWSLAGVDETPAQTVTVRADDGHGATASVTFTFAVATAAPVVTIGAGPASGPEGTPITLTGSAKSPSAADNAAGFTYAWTVTKNGSPFASGTGASFTFTPDDEGTFAASLQATDDGGAAATSTVSIAGVNVAPVASITGVTHDTLVLVPQQAITFTGGFTDPGKLDTHTATLDWGDGTPPDTYSFAAGDPGDTTDTHAYSAAGTYTITYSVSDDDGGTSSLSVQVTVETAAQALSAIDAFVGSMGSLNGGEKQGLSAKLDAAAQSSARGDLNATCGQLGAFLNDLVALTNSGRLSPSDSSTLASSVWAVHRALGCTKVKVAWLSLGL
jgi:hypothetical protein